MAATLGPFKSRPTQIGRFEITGLDATLTVNPDFGCGPQSGDYVGTVNRFALGTFTGSIYGQRCIVHHDAASPDTLSGGYEPQGVISFYDACVYWDLLGCTTVRSTPFPQHDIAVYWPAGDTTDAELIFYFDFDSVKLNTITGNIGPNFGAVGSSTEGETATTYWEDIGIAVADDTYYNS